MNQEKTPKIPSTNNVLIEKLLYQQVKKPSNTIATKIINVFENRYRINIYIKLEENGYVKRKIGASYFAKLNEDKLEILKNSDYKNE
jgi:hypothetical protein